MTGAVSVLSAKVRTPQVWEWGASAWGRGLCSDGEGFCSLNAAGSPHALALMVKR